MTQRLVENTLHTLAHFRLHRLRYSAGFLGEKFKLMPNFRISGLNRYTHIWRFGATQILTL